MSLIFEAKKEYNDDKAPYLIFVSLVVSQSESTSQKYVIVELPEGADIKQQRARPMVRGLVEVSGIHAS